MAVLGSQNRRFGFKDPTKDPIVTFIRQGYLSNDAKRGTFPPLRSAPLPAYKAESAL